MRAAPPPKTAADAPSGAFDGHLARLVQRARPAEPLLKRRQPSMFESSRPATQAHGADDEFVDALPYASMPITAPRRGEASHAHEAAPRRLEADDGGVARSPQATSMQALQPAPPPPLHPTPATLRVDASMRLAPATPSAAERAIGLGAPARAASPTPADDTPLPRPREATAVVTLSRHRPHDESGTSPTHRSRALTESSPERTRPANANPEALLRPARAAATPPAGDPRGVQRAAIAPGLRGPQAPHAAPPREVAPVQVTIGRIEVRAVAAPAAAPARGVVRAAPRLGLEQYLRERHGGRR